jgi:hypothetical protein
LEIAELPADKQQEMMKVLADLVCQIEKK